MTFGYFWQNCRCSSSMLKQLVPLRILMDFGVLWHFGILLRTEWRHPWHPHYIIHLLRHKKLNKHQCHVTDQEFCHQLHAHKKKAWNIKMDNQVSPHLYSRSTPFFTSCLIGFIASPVAISYFLAANTGRSWVGEAQEHLLNLEKWGIGEPTVELL